MNDNEKWLTQELLNQCKLMNKRTAQWAAETLLREISSNKDFEYVDNWRVADLKIKAQVDQYQSIKQDGCCGFHDFVAKSPDGHKFMLGFNYGH